MTGKKIKPNKENAELTYETFTAFLETIKLYTYDELSQILRGDHV